MERSIIWKEAVGTYKNKWICQIVENGKVRVVSGNTYLECAQKVKEEMYGKR